MHPLGLLPLVKSLRVHERNDNGVGFSPKMFNYRTLRQFRALINVQAVWIDYLDIPNFLPQIQQYFGHFLPTLQSLGLRTPRGSNRQIIYFVGIFQHLQEFRLTNSGADVQGEPADDPTLIPLFSPPLRGWLIMMWVKRVGLVKDMIDLLGGIRFRYMGLCDVHGMRLLLDACANTLETLFLSPTDPHGEKLCLNRTHALANDSTASSSLGDFDLSRIESFRTLKISASSFNHTPTDGSPDTTAFLKHVLSTITSSAPTSLFIHYTADDFCGVK